MVALSLSFVLVFRVGLMGTTGVIAVSVFVFLSFLILLTAFFSPIARKIGIRNVSRRITNTVLVVIGSLVGTALISGSLVLSDSLDKTFLKLVEEQLGEVDALVYLEEKSLVPGLPTHLSPQETKKVTNALKTDGIDGVIAAYYIMVSPQKIDQEGNPIINTYLVDLFGIDFEDTNTFGTNPQILPRIAKDNGAYVSSSLAESLELKVGDRIRVPYGPLKIDLEVSKIYEDKGIVGGKRIIVNNSLVTKSLRLPEGSNNYVIVSATGQTKPQNYDGEKFSKRIEEILSKVELKNVKFNVLEQKEQALNGWGLKLFANIFLVLSLFGIFAGILLIINLYLMLAGERKYEMGILRAIALGRIQLTKTFIYEGFVYSVVSSLIGTFVGLGVGYVLVYALRGMFNDLFTSFGEEDFFAIIFDFKIQSLIIAFSAGATITLITAIISSYKISKLNIVSAIRNLPVTRKAKIGFRWIVNTLFLAIFFLISLISFLSSFSIREMLENMREEGLGGKSNQFSEMSQSSFDDNVTLIRSYAFYMGFIFTLLFGSVLLSRLLGLKIRKNTSRVIATISGLVAIFFTAGMTNYDYVVDAFNQNAGIILIFVSGLALVVALSVVVTYNLELITKLFTAILYPIASLRTVVRTSLRYPSVNPSRTGLTLIMFAVIIFLIAYISMVKVTIKQQSEGSLDKALGGYESMIVPSMELTGEQIEEIITIAKESKNTEEVAMLAHAPVIMPEYKYKDLSGMTPQGPQDTSYKPEDLYRTTFDGLPPDFIQNVDIKLGERAEMYATDRQAWDAVINDSRNVILGQSFTAEAGLKRPKLKVGDKVKIADIFNQEVLEKEVIGIVRVEAGIGIGGQFYANVITTTDHLQRDMPSAYLDKFSAKEVLVKFSDGVNLSGAVRDLKKDLIDYNIILVLELTELTRQTQSFMDSIVAMMQGFLAFSLIVGTSGLAIIMARSVQERKQQIGMLRSLGFQRWMILIGFFIESTFITILGIAIGISMGTIGALNAYNAAFKDQEDLSPVFPVGEIAIICLSVYLAALLFALLPSIKAARLSPVEATNYPQ